MYDVIAWLINNYNTHNISQSTGNQTMKFGQVIEYNNIIIFLHKSCTKCDRGTSPRPLFVFLKSLYKGSAA